MLKEAYLSEVGRRVSKRQCVIVCRGKGNDELAPNWDIFGDFKKLKELYEQDHGISSVRAHNEAFVEVRYPARFRKKILNDPEAMMTLKELCLWAEDEDVYLVCYEGSEKACHRRILLRICEEKFGADIEVKGVEFL